MKRKIIKSPMLERDYDRWLKINDYEQWLKNKKLKSAVQSWVSRNKERIAVTGFSLLFITAMLFVVFTLVSSIEAAGGIRQIIIDLGKEIVSIADEIKGK